MDITELTVHELQEKIKNKELTITEITKAYVDRMNEKEKDVQAFITELKDEALKQSEEIQNKIDNGEKLGDLAGIPIGIKDIICTKGVKTTCASKMLENFVSPYDATVMEKINAENMIDLGKLNMDEFAMGGSTEYSYFKKTRNPWDLSRVPGGSSGGSAAAVSATMGTRNRYRWKYKTTSFIMWCCWVKTYLWISIKIWSSSICIIIRSSWSIYKRCSRLCNVIKCNCWI